MNSFRYSILLVLLSIRLTGQEMPGLVNGNYQPTASVWINPSSPLHGKPWFEAQMAVGVFGYNTAFYIPGSDFAWYNLLSSSYLMPKYGNYERPYLVKSQPQLHSLNVTERVQLPGLIYVNHQNAYGFHLALRTAVSGRRLPYEAFNFAYFDLGYPPQQYIEYTDYDISAAALNWFELGLTYARTVRYKRYSIVNAGFSVKRVLATGGAFLDVDKIRYMVLNDSTVDIRSLDAEFGLSLPIDYNSNEYNSSQGLFTGSGFSVDLGVTFIRTLREVKRMNMGRAACEWRFVPYRYRLGVSLIDFGWASFSDNAQVHSFKNVAHFWDRIDTIAFSSINRTFHELSQRFYGDSTRSLVSNSFSMGLPTAISIQFDYFLRENWYLNASWVQGIQAPASRQVRRSSWLAVAPRYETDLWEVNFPVALFDYREPRIGLSLRFMGFTLGTEKLGTLLGMGDFYGMDFYASLKFSILKGHCLGGDDSTPCGNLDFK